ncbi:phosphoribosylformylglycinamidine synthase subunit PurL, partial [Candidatus Sumerlaeota bacterium]|nr:phosphoribosylformylglycinamidine synthase subunit PurL [Candidatus Sumerlaeota bacterium]
KTLPTEGEHILQGPGENAGVVEFGDGLAVVFKIESHNHPSAIEPYQGAATGIGGILRDIFTMGARPIALVDPLRFGDPSLPRNRYIAEGVVAGIADYGNCVGVPTVAGDVYFSSAYNGNPLVNVMCVGITKKEHLTLATARHPGNLVVYFGNATGRDGIHGATFASEELDEEAEKKRPAVQVGDPFMEKKILEASLELIESGVVEAMQDMGAAGLTCSTCELAGRGGLGIEIELNKVPQRAANMSPYELMLSESQERMLAIIPEAKWELARSILEKWEVNPRVIGRTTADGLMRVKSNGKVVAEIPAAKISSDSPCYIREAQRPAYLEQVEIFSSERIPEPEDYTRTLQRLLSSPTIASKRWIYEQYDYMVQTNTVLGPGENAAVLRVRGTDKALGITADCNALYCYLDPYKGAAIAVAEAGRNLAVVGARPLAITNCLNFGNPTKPDIFWQFKECVRGMCDACIALNTPVTGGNVSFYNEFEGKAVFPTPVIGMIGRIDSLQDVMTSGFKAEKDCIILIEPEDTELHLGGSHYIDYLHKKIMGPCPGIDLESARNLILLTLSLIKQHLIKSATDLSEGGLAVALVESIIRAPEPVGAEITLPERVRPDIELFSEAQSRILVSAEAENIARIEKECTRLGFRAIRIGTTSSVEHLKVNGLIDISKNAMLHSIQHLPW